MSVRDEEDYNNFPEKDQRNYSNKHNLNYSPNPNEEENEIQELNNDNEEEIDQAGNDLRKFNLVGIDTITHCQNCGNEFNNSENQPYSFKCGHIFCKNCIISVFSENNNYFCPEDGLIGSSWEEMKLLKNLIPSENKESERAIKDEKLNSEITTVAKLVDNEIKINRCDSHPDQKLSHYIENTDEIICVHCAFQRLRTSPELTIKEIGEKLQEIINDLDKISNENSLILNKLNISLTGSIKNFKDEENSISGLFDNIIAMFLEKKKEALEAINSLFQSNETKINEFKEEIEKKSQKTDSLRRNLKELLQGNSKLDLVQNFESGQDLIKSNQNSRNTLDLKEFKYYYEDTLRIKKLVDNIGEVRMKSLLTNFNSNLKNPLMNQLNVSSSYDLNSSINKERLQARKPSDHYENFVYESQNVNHNPRYYSDYRLKPETKGFNTKVPNYPVKPNYDYNNNKNEFEFTNLNKYSSAFSGIQDNERDSSLIRSRKGDQNQLSIKKEPGNSGKIINNDFYQNKSLTNSFDHKEDYPRSLNSKFK